MADTVAGNLTNKIEVSVLMPALNEEKNIILASTNALKALDNLGIAGELIVINDGSTDGTEGLVNSLMKTEPRLRLIKHPLPRGIGASFWDGVDEARGDAVVLLPGDDENYPFEILRYHQLLEHVDIVIPFIFNKEARSLFRNMLSFIYRFIINATFRVNFNYTNGTVLYRKSLLQAFRNRSGSFFFQTEILIRTVKQGYLFAEVPYRLGVRKAGKSRALTFPSFLQVSGGYLNLVKEYYFNADRKVKADFTENSLTAIRRSAK